MFIIIRIIESKIQYNDFLIIKGRVNIFMNKIRSNVFLKEVVKIVGFEKDGSVK